MNMHRTHSGREHAGKRRSSLTRVRPGFTLVEMLIAISVLAVVAILGWRGLDSIVRARVALTSALDQTRSMQLTFAQLQSDCANVVNSSVIPGRMPVIASNGRLILIRNVFEDNQPSRLQVVLYRLQEGVLTRRESAGTRELPQLDSFWQAANSGVTETQSVVLLTDLKAMIVQSWYNDTPGWRVTDVQDAAQQSAVGSTNPLPMPAGLEFSLQSNSSGASMTKIFLVGSL